MAITDMFTVEVLKPHGRARYVTLLVMALSGRRISIAGLAVKVGRKLASWNVADGWVAC